MNMIVTLMLQDPSVSIKEVMKCTLVLLMGNDYDNIQNKQESVQIRKLFKNFNDSIENLSE